MYILGINDGHLATACLLKDGEIIACTSEERFTGIKNQAGIPQKSISYCLDLENIHPEQIDLVVFAGKILPPTTHNTKLNSGAYSKIYFFVKPLLTHSRYLSIKLPLIRTLEDFLYEQFFNFLHLFVEGKRKKILLGMFSFVPERIIFIDHHLAHVYSTLYSSNFANQNKDTLILTCDGEGDKLSATVNVFKNKKIKVISRTSMTNSLGNLYRSVTKYLGMKPLEHEYKVMGLAAYVDKKDSRANELYKKLRKLIFIDSNSLQIKTSVNSQLFKLGYLDSYFKDYRFDHISFATQKVTEKILINWAKSAVKKTKIHTIALSGGVFMNVKANQKIAELREVKEIFIMPSCGDESNAIGAAYYGYLNKTSQIPNSLKHIYLGPEFSKEQIDKAISKVKSKYIINKPKNIEQSIARLLAKGEIVARFNGRSEWGARALGNRSILADPSRLDVVEIINKMIKSRDFWMPFAPVVMQEHSKKYFVSKKIIDAQYMIITFNTTDLGKKDLKAAIHQYDKSVRPQIIKKDTNPSYYKIIEEFSKITGNYGLLNTSFNLHGYPIVGTPENALYVFANSGLKFLALGQYIIEKKHA